MDEIKKMIQFDYINCIGIGGRYAFIIAVLFFAASLLGAYPAAIGFIIAPLALFSPIETVRKGDFMKIYGLLPVKRESVIKALFAEIIIPQTIGGILGELCLLISRAVGESGILPKFIQERTYEDLTVSTKQVGLNYSNWFVMLAAGLAMLTAIICLFYAVKEIKGDTVAIVACIPFLVIIGALMIVYFITLDYGILPLPQEFLPTAPLPVALIVAACFAAFIAFGWLMCRLTIKLTADKEM
ncbi:MAG: hypothetical protein J6U16_05095 [Ruminococcus sp.]|nr:hypothetical protein [Ruminococcus sp.]